MKKKLLAAAVVICFGNVAYAENNGEGIYFGGQLGNGFLKADSITSNISETGTATLPSLINAGSTNEYTSARAVYIGYNYDSTYDVPLRIEFAYTVNDSLNKQTNTTSTSMGTSSVDTYHKIKLAMKTFMLNGYFDLYTYSNYTPFITAGAGLAMTDLATSIGLPSDNTVESYEISKTNFKFAWSLGAGLSYSLNPHCIVDLTVNYVNSQKINVSGFYGDNVNGTTSLLPSTVNTMFGIRYTF